MSSDGVLTLICMMLPVVLAGARLMDDLIFCGLGCALFLGFGVYARSLKWL